jgi:hypothetical protein
MKELSEYQDNHGYIGHFDKHRQLEFGDCGQRMGAFCNTDTNIHGTAGEKADLLSEFASKCWDNDAREPTRYPPMYSDMWYSKLGYMSYDNLVAQIIAAGRHDGRDLYLRLWVNAVYKALKARWGFLWNKFEIHDTEREKLTRDWGGPGLLAVFIRSMWNKKPWYLFFLDFTLISSALVRVGASKVDPDDVGPDLNFFERIEQASRVFPTWASKLASRIYFRKRLRAGVDVDSRLEGIPVVTAFQHYYRHPQCPPIDEVKKAQIKALHLYFT